MTHQNVTNTVQVDMRFAMAGNNAANVLHVGYTGTVGIPDLDALDTVIEAWLTSEWKPLSSELWGAEGIILTDLNSLTGPRKAYSIDPVIVGDLTGGAPPASVTIAIKADVGHRGRGTSGRVFWIGLAESQLTANTVDSATANLIIVALGDLDTNIAGISPFSGLVVPHRQVAGVRPEPATSEAVIGFLVSDFSVDVQKNRLPFHRKKKRLPIA